MKKTIIVNSGISRQGKSCSIKNVFYKLQDHPLAYTKDKYDNPYYGDIKAYFTIKDKKIGIESLGDPDPRTLMEESLEEFVKKDCDIIVIACRTSGKTKNAIWKQAKDNNYNIIWAANNRSELNDPKINDYFNDLYAEQTVQLIFDIIDGKIY